MPIDRGAHCSAQDASRRSLSGTSAPLDSVVDRGHLGVCWRGTRLELVTGLLNNRNATGHDLSYGVYMAGPPSLLHIRVAYYTASEM